MPLWLPKWPTFFGTKQFQVVNHLTMVWFYMNYNGMIILLSLTFYLGWSNGRLVLHTMDNLLDLLKIQLSRHKWKDNDSWKPHSTSKEVPSFGECVWCLSSFASFNLIRGLHHAMFCDSFLLLEPHSIGEQPTKPLSSWFGRPTFETVGLFNHEIRYFNVWLFYRIIEVISSITICDHFFTTRV